MSSDNLLRAFVPLRIAVLTVSDTRSLDDDASGGVLVDRLLRAGHSLADRCVVVDDSAAIIGCLRDWIDRAAMDVVLITGGTGVTGRDVTPEAVTAVMDKEIPGFGELFRWLSFGKIGTATILSRAMAAVAGGMYLFALPGSPSACRDAWDDILVHQFDARHRPCNLAELLPRLTER